jgi:transcriptional regulator with XRE-family HTH domain
MEMILSHDDLMNADYSNRVMGCGWTSQSVIGGFLLGVLAGPGAASAQKQCFSGLDFSRFQQDQPLSFSAVEASPAVVPVAELINNIKHGWSINMTELAELMGVQRPTLYNWLNGKTSPDVQLQKHLQTLAATAADWQESTAGANWDFLLDYTGPRADEVTIRETLAQPDVSTSEIRHMIHERMKQYQAAYTQSREILGEPVPVKGEPIRESTRKLNKLWTENAQRTHRARNASR